MASNDTFGKLLGEWGRDNALYVALAVALGFLLFIIVYPFL